MIINKHIAFRHEDELELVSYLQKNNIEFLFDEFICVLDILESNPHWEFIAEYIKKRDMFCVTETIFEKSELKSADWLQVRSKWHFEYPQPEDDFLGKTVTYTLENYCVDCGCGLQQVNPFRVKKMPKWSKRHFLMLNWIGDELFVDEVAKNALENEFPFLSFGAVCNKTGTKEYDNFYQIIMPTLSDNAVVGGQRYFREILVCQSCGSRKYHPSGEGKLQLDKNLLKDAPDMFKTKDWFGWDKGADHKIIISQKMYQFIVLSKFDSGLEFAPIDMS